MRLITLHCDWIEFEPVKQALRDARYVEKVKKEKQRFEDCLVVLTAAEQEDEKNPDAVAKEYANEVKEVAAQVNARSIVLYPFVHLTSTPSSPHCALKILKKAADELKLSKGFNVTRAPFGWYKAFNLRCKGHPLAELSREIKIEEGEEKISKSLEAEERLKSAWYILDTSGELVPVDKFDFEGQENLKKFATYEMKKVRGVEETPPHVKLMRKLEIADYEPVSDPGNLRFLPKGKLIKNLLEDLVSRISIGYGAIEVETPIMYDLAHPTMADYLNRFPARHYILESVKKKFFLRFSACFGQFLTGSRMTISYKDIPLKMYELTRYSFRREKRGELVGLRRLRSFTMPDMHTFCEDLEKSKKEFKKQFKLCMSWMRDIGFSPKDYETGIRFTEAFYKDNKEFIHSLVKLTGRPALIEVWKKRYAYFDPKFEFNVVDALGKASALSTVQIDHENARRYGIKFIDRDGKERYPLILHASISGGIERCMYAMLEKIWLESKKGKNPILPLWLSPTQVRLCTVSDRYLGYAQKIADKLEREQIRVDIDDRVESVQRKIRDAEVEWIPLIIVIGEKEEKSGKLAVRFRETGKVKKMKLEDIIKHVHGKTKGYPFRPLSLRRLISKRPKFVG